MKFILSSLTLIVVASEAATIRRKTMLLPAAQECDPKKVAELRMISPSQSSCGPNSHCVINGNSSLGGYCHDNDTKATMDMPEAMRGLCFICESPERTDSIVTKPDDIIGAFTCGDLEQMGKNGDISSDQCEVFQRMIAANDSCGCSGVPALTDVASSPVDNLYEDHGDSIDTNDEDHGDSIGTNDGDKIIPGTLSESNPFGFAESGSLSQKAIVIAGVTSVVTFLLALS